MVRDILNFILKNDGVNVLYIAQRSTNLGRRTLGLLTILTTDPNGYKKFNFFFNIHLFFFHID